MGATVFYAAKEKSRVTEAVPRDFVLACVGNPRLTMCFGGGIVEFSDDSLICHIAHRFIELRRTNADASGQTLTATDPGATGAPAAGSVSQGDPATTTAGPSPASPTPP